MKNRLLQLAAIPLCVLACGSARGQGCGPSVMHSHYSDYVSWSVSGNTIYTTVQVSGYATLDPGNYCPPSLRHQGQVYNTIGSTGGWAYGTPVYPTSSVNTANNQSLTGTVGQSYTFNWRAQVNCSIAGTFWSDAGTQNIPLPTISGPSTLWWFTGLGLGVSGYASQITLTASPGGTGSSYSWAIRSGSDKVSLSPSTSASVTVTSIGKSQQANDVAITVTLGGVTSPPFNLTVRAPYTLGTDPLQPTPVYYFDATYAWMTDIYYRVLDNLLAPMPVSLPVNESFGADVPDYANENWQHSGPGCANTDSAADFYDHIGGELTTQVPTPYPTPVYNTSWTGPKVYHFSQDWRIGTCTIGSGPRVQNDQLQRYTDHGAHNAIISPDP